MPKYSRSPLRKKGDSTHELTSPRSIRRPGLRPRAHRRLRLVGPERTWPRLGLHVRGPGVHRPDGFDGGIPREPSEGRSRDSAGRWPSTQAERFRCAGVPGHAGGGSAVHPARGGPSGLWGSVPGGAPRERHRLQVHVRRLPLHESHDVHVRERQPDPDRNVELHADALRAGRASGATTLRDARFPERRRWEGLDLGARPGASMNEFASAHG